MLKELDKPKLPCKSKLHGNGFTFELMEQYFCLKPVDELENTTHNNALHDIAALK